MHEQMATTRFPTAAPCAPSTIRRLTDVINEVDDDAESGMWHRAGTRTNPADVARLLRTRR
jgi:hypothetical protein